MNTYYVGESAYGIYIVKACNRKPLVKYALLGEFSDYDTALAYKNANEPTFKNLLREALPYEITKDEYAVQHCEIKSTNPLALKQHKVKLGIYKLHRKSKRNASLNTSHKRFKKAKRKSQRKRHTGASISFKNNEVVVRYH